VATGMFGAFAVAAALAERAASGRGRHIDLAMFDSLLAMQVTALSRFWASGEAPQRVGNRHPVTTPVDTFRTCNGLVAMVVPSDAHFKRLCVLMQRPELAADARFADNAGRAKHHAALKELIEQWSAGLTTEECVASCAKADIPAGPVWDLKQAATSEHAMARTLVNHAPHPAFGTQNDVAQREPLLGEHTREVLRDRLGIREDELDSLRREGAI